jgi:hypothetical protein
MLTGAIFTGSHLDRVSVYVQRCADSISWAEFRGVSWINEVATKNQTLSLIETDTGASARLFDG